MRRGRLVLTYAFLALGVTTGGFSCATQLAAARLAYQPALGQPLTLLGLHFYPPWSWVVWDADFAPYAPEVFRATRTIGWAAVLVPWFPLVLGALVLARRRPSSTAHGSARWADLEDLRKAGMLGGAGVVLCQTNEARYVAGAKSGSYRLARPGHLVTHDGPEHVMVFAPTRSGKGIGTVIPTLLSWRHSALIYDIKKELWTRTAGWRRQFSRCWRFPEGARRARRGRSGELTEGRLSDKRPLVLPIPRGMAGTAPGKTPPRD